MDDSTIERMRERARTMRRAADFSANQEIRELLLRAANEAEADANALEAELHRPDQPLPPQS